MSNETFELTNEYISQILEDQEIYSMIMEEYMLDEEEILLHKKLGTLNKLWELTESINDIVMTDKFLYMEDDITTNANSERIYEFGISIHDLNGIFIGQQQGDLSDCLTLYSNNYDILYEELTTNY